ncbi:hypothetical protein NP233_g11565 [Leucocoprinus birnbaumii]|uniref:Heterokaryon incompatibility domain-containing protein n=1 Tax=Leucocoprinus birnbaumii TaxID=56174 RepID=A0AAD5VM92_9AGAR|nr:hypothetical protein NP233_g11565 [Leucocoprinus birnbaumii]
MANIQPDPLLAVLQSTNNDLRKAWSLITTNARPRRLIHEDPGVRGPLWFWSDPETSGSPLHITANILRIIFALLTAPSWMWIAPADVIRPKLKKWFRDTFWSRQWEIAPEAFLSELNGSSAAMMGSKDGMGGMGGQYAVNASGADPRWLLEVQFSGEKVVKKRQVRYDDVKRRIQDAGYTAIAYSQQSAEQIHLLSSGERVTNNPSKFGSYSLSERKKLATAMLDEYAKARTTAIVKGGKTDGVEYIWLDEFCLVEDEEKNETQLMRQRDAEMGRWADIFRLAKRVAVLCHIVGCEHTGVDCPWANRLFTLAEIMHATKVLRVKRFRGDEDGAEDAGIIISSSGSEFRAEIRARAAEAKLWHLHNLMQHANDSSSGITRQSTVHSLVLEVLRRRDLESSSASQKYLGKALNGLLPRRARLEDLTGIDGPADLLWLLELNQGFYNAALLTSVSRLAESDVLDGYRWCQGKTIIPKEGSERLEPLSTAIPIKFHDKFTNEVVPVLSLANTKTVALEHMLERDSGALERQEELKCLKFMARFIWGCLVFLGIILSLAIGGAGIIILYIASIFYVILQLFVGTIYVTREHWVVIEDYKAPGSNAIKLLQAQDPSFKGGLEWGSNTGRQMTPRWEEGIRHVMEPKTTDTQSKDAAYPYPVTLVDLSTGVFVKSLVTSKPNDMAVLAIHGMGVSCVLLDRDKRTRKGPTIGVKVGMVNVPPYVLAQASLVGSLYVGGHAFRAVQPRVPFLTWFGCMIKGVDPDATERGIRSLVREKAGRRVEDLEMQRVDLDSGSTLKQTTSISSTAPILHKKAVPYRTNTTSSSSTTVNGDADPFQGGSDVGDGPVPPPLPSNRYRRDPPNVQWFPERRGAENV